MPTIPKFYDDNEVSQSETRLYRWNFCYLHGEAEFEFADTPDIFLSDKPMPIVAGSYPVSIRGLPAVAVIAAREHQQHLLSGRVALVSDTESLKHALDVGAWK